jgi:hypothetical protein
MRYESREVPEPWILEGGRVCRAKEKEVSPTLN